MMSSTCPDQRKVAEIDACQHLAVDIKFQMAKPIIISHVFDVVMLTWNSDFSLHIGVNHEHVPSGYDDKHLKVSICKQ